MKRYSPSQEPKPQCVLLVQMHIVKNYIVDQLQGVNPPLILGIWGPKGCGKTFQTELALKKLGCAHLIPHLTWHSIAQMAHALCKPSLRLDPYSVRSP